jgi:hypothetical protein
MTIKLTTQQDALRNIIQTLTKLNKESTSIEKATLNCEVNNGKTVIRVEIVAK